MRITLKAKIWLTVSSITLLFAGFLFFYFPAKQQKTLQESFEKEVYVTAKTVALGVSIALTEQNFKGVKTSMEYIKSDPRFVFAALVQTDTLKIQNEIEVSQDVFAVEPFGYEYDPKTTSVEGIMIKRYPFYSPTMNGDIVVGFSEDSIHEKLADVKMKGLSIASGVFLFGILVGFILDRHISKPLHHLQRVATLVGKGNREIQLTLKRKDEIGDLADSFNKMTRELKEADLVIADQTESLIDTKNVLEEQHSLMHSSIIYAQKIQKAILPNHGDIKGPFSDLEVFFEPRDIVSGDFYYVAEKDGKHIIAAVDCTGHGVPGGFMSMIGYSLLNQVIFDRGMTDAADILTQLDVELKTGLHHDREDVSIQDGMDMSLVVYGPSKKEIQFAGANNPILIMSDGELKKFKGTKRGIAGSSYKDAPFLAETISVKEGDNIFMFSDGFQDQFGGPNERKYMVKRMRDLFVKISSETCSRQKELISKEFEEWRGYGDQTDDILIITAKV